MTLGRWTLASDRRTPDEGRGTIGVNRKLGNAGKGNIAHSRTLATRAGNPSRTPAPWQRGPGNPSRTPAPWRRGPGAIAALLRNNSSIARPSAHLLRLLGARTKALRVARQIRRRRHTGSPAGPAVCHQATYTHTPSTASVSKWPSGAHRHLTTLRVPVWLRQRARPTTRARLVSHRRQVGRWRWLLDPQRQRTTRRGSGYPLPAFKLSRRACLSWAVPRDTTSRPHFATRADSRSPSPSRAAAATASTTPPAPRPAPTAAPPCPPPTDPGRCEKTPPQSRAETLPRPHQDRAETPPQSGPPTRSQAMHPLRRPHPRQRPRAATARPCAAEKR